MGLMDRVKAQAAQIAQQAQEAAQEGRARLDQAQASRRGDALLRQLGAVVFAERTGRGAADSQAKIDQLINDIAAYERENGLDLTNPAQQGFPPLGFPGGGTGPFPVRPAVHPLMLAATQSPTLQVRCRAQAGRRRSTRQRPSSQPRATTSPADR